jgi:hypothetical protein
MGKSHLWIQSRMDFSYRHLFIPAERFAGVFIPAIKVMPAAEAISFRQTAFFTGMAPE